MREYFLTLLVAAAVTYLLAGPCRAIAMRTGTVAPVRARDVHSVPIPYFGGVAMLGGLVVAILLASRMPFLGRHPEVAHDALGVVWAAAVICAVGVLDDKYDLPAFVKLGGQVLAAGLAVLQGVRMYWIPLPDSIFQLDATSSILVTVLFIVVCTNAVNFVDGLDGLAAGVVAIGAGAFATYTYVLAYEQELVRASTASLITIVTCGICVGFLPHNLHPARMFMGDSGAMMLGLLMALSSISLTGQIDPSVLAAHPSDVFPALLPVILPFMVLFLPLLDLVLAYLRRTKAGQPWYVADKKHLHHRLMARGHSHRAAVAIMWGWTAVLSFGLVLPLLVPWGAALGIWGVGALVTVFFTLRRHSTTEAQDA